MEQMSLFANAHVPSPLASRLLPESLEDYVEQQHLIGKDKLLGNLIEQDAIFAMIFWDMPGMGKLMKQLDCSKGYIYVHDSKEKMAHIT